MARPVKCRRVCRFPEVTAFRPEGEGSEIAPVVLTLDEFEAVRLIDREGLSQEQCSERMQVARTTAQRIYDNARLKLALMVTEGRPLIIEGGDFRLCDGKTSCGAEICRKQRLFSSIEHNDTEKGEHIMRIAVTYENGEVFGHFGHTEQFKIYDITDNAVASSKVVDTNGSGHGALAEMLHLLKVDVLICGGIGGGAKMALASAGIKLYGGVSGSSDEAVAAFLAGKLDFNPNVLCNHHGEHHHDHNCGDHGCGSHGCGGHKCHD